MIFFNEYKGNLGKSFTWFVFLLIIISMFLLAFPIINDPSVGPIVVNNLDLIPESITDVVFPYGLEIFEDYELYFKSILVFVQFIVVVFALNIGLMSLAKEQGFGTIDYLYINPISRTDILVSKYIANLIHVISFSIISFLIGIFIFTYISEVDFLSTIKGYIVELVIVIFEGIMFLSLGTMISALSKRISGLNSLATIIMLVVLLINIVLSLELINIGPLSSLIPLRTLQQTNPTDLVTTLINLGVGKLLPSILFIVIAYISYNKKDLTI